jgi:hypothetical protein
MQNLRENVWKVHFGAQKDRQTFRTSSLVLCFACNRRRCVDERAYCDKCRRSRAINLLTPLSRLAWFLHVTNIPGDSVSEEVERQSLVHGKWWTRRSALTFKLKFSAAVIGLGARLLQTRLFLTVNQQQFSGLINDTLSRHWLCDKTDM